MIKNTLLGGSDFSTPTARIKPTDLNDTFDAAATEISTLAARTPIFMSDTCNNSSNTEAWTTVKTTDVEDYNIKSFNWIVGVNTHSSSHTGSARFLITFTDTTTDTATTISGVLADRMVSSAGSYSSTKTIKTIEWQLIYTDGHYMRYRNANTSNIDEVYGAMVSVINWITY